MDEWSSVVHIQLIICVQMNNLRNFELIKEITFGEIFLVSNCSFESKNNLNKMCIMHHTQFNLSIRISHRGDYKLRMSDCLSFAVITNAVYHSLNISKKFNQNNALKINTSITCIYFH